MLAVLDSAKHKDVFQKTMLKTLRQRMDSERLTDADLMWIHSSYVLELQKIPSKKK